MMVLILIWLILTLVSAYILFRRPGSRKLCATATAIEIGVGTCLCAAAIMAGMLVTLGSLRLLQWLWQGLFVR